MPRKQPSGLTRYFRQVIGQILSGRADKQNRQTRRHLKFEPLEGRQLLASDLASLTGVVSLTNPVVGANINLYKNADSDDLFEPGGEDGAATTVQTDGAGVYRFDNLVAGNYWLEQPEQTVGSDQLVAFAKQVTISADDAGGTAGTVIDNFADVPDAVVTSTAGTESGHFDHAQALGGERDMTVTLKSGTTAPSVSLTSAGNQLLFDSSIDAQGLFNVVYDGDDNDTSLPPSVTTMPSQDLTESGANTSIKIRAEADHADATVRMRVYTTATDFSESVEFTIPDNTGPEDFVFYFSEFTDAGGTGADFADVRALELVIETNTDATDGLVTLLGAFAPKVVTQDLTNVDLSLDKIVNNAAPNINEQVTFTLTLTNPAGGADATGIVVADNLPAGLTLDSSQPSQGTFVGGVWTVGTLASGATATLDIVATVTSAAELNNTATITAAGQPDSNPANNTDGAIVDAVDPVTSANLSLTQTVTDETPDLNSQVTFLLTLSNAGPDTATGVEVTDLLPAGLDIDDFTASAGTSYDEITGIWTIGTVNSGADATLSIVVTVTGAGPLDSVAEVTAANEADPNSTPDNGLEDEDDQQTVTVDAVDPTASADLSLAITPPTQTPEVGQDATFTITLTNGGPDAATNVKVKDVLPAGLVLQSATPDAGTYDDVNKEWTIPSLASGAVAELVVVARVDTSAEVTYSAQVTASDVFDPDSTPDDGEGDDSASATVDAPGEAAVANLAVTITPETATPNQGQDVTFTVTLANSGPDTATNIVVTDVIPAGLVRQSATPEVGNYNTTNNQWTIPTLASGEDVVLTVVLRADVATEVIYSAQVTASDQVDPNSTPDDGTGDDFDSSTVNAVAADLSLAITPATQTPAVGQDATFTITLTNGGPDAATNIVVEDVLPAGLDFQSATPSAGTYDDVNKEWTIPSLASGQSVTLVVVAEVQSGALLTYSAQVTASDQFDPDSVPDDGAGDDRATATVGVLSGADLSVTVTPSSAAPNFGSNVTFTIVVTNGGPDAATGVVVTNVLPTGLAFQSFEAPAGTSFVSATGVWTVGNLASGTSQTLTVTARVNTTAAVEDVAQVTASGTPDPDSTPNDNTGDDRGVGAIDAPAAADLRLAKTRTSGVVNVGQPVTFTLTLTNDGPDAATGVAVTDQLPAGLTFVSAQASIGSYDELSGIWTVGTVNNGGFATLTIVATLTTAGTKTNTAQVTASNEFDPDSTPNDNAGDDRATTTVASTLLSKRRFLAR